MLTLSIIQFVKSFKFDYEDEVRVVCAERIFQRAITEYFIHLFHEINSEANKCTRARATTNNSNNEIISHLRTRIVHLKCER